ncbi:MAG: NADH-quinone oxidoreductase subunit N [Bacteroidota bacterium]
MVDPSIIRSIVDNRASLPFILPAVIIAGALLVVLIAGLLAKRRRYWLHLIATQGICLALYATIRLGSQPSVQAGIPLFNHLIKLDPWAIFFHVLLMSITLCILLIPNQENQHDPDLDATAVYVVMILSTLLATYFLAMANHWLIIYLSLALMTLSSAVLVYSHLQSQGAVASLKYILYSAVGAAIMLWGMSYLYGITATLGLAEPGAMYGLQATPSPILLIGLFLALSGILMKLGIFPFHFWIADVYQGASMTVVAYLATVPKLAAVAVMVRLCKQLIPQLSVASNHLQSFIALIAILTIVIGHVAALAQSHPKRVLAYGSIAQGGLLMAGVGTCTDSYASIAYYSMIYSIMGLAAWVGLRILRTITDSERMQDYAGLGRRFPVLGICLVIAMLSLIGLPPTAGFTGKLLIFSTLLEAAQAIDNPLLAILLVLSVLGSVISLYYYLKLPCALFFKPRQQQALISSIPLIEQLVLMLLAVVLLGLFFGANMLVEILQKWSIIP